MSEINYTAAIEAILFASGASVEASRIAEALEISEKQAIEYAETLIEEYKAADLSLIHI